MISSAFISVFANRNCSLPVWSVRLALGVLGVLSVFGQGAAAESNALTEAMHSLAIEVASSRNPRAPFHLVWQNDSSLSNAQSDSLCQQFSAQLSVVPNFLTDRPSSPALRVTLRETPSYLVIVLRMPAAEGEQVRLVRVSRTSFDAGDALQQTPYLLKQLLWKQREPIFSAMEHDSALPGGSANLLLVLGRETLSVYRRLQDSLVLQATARIPGPFAAARDPRGQIHFATGGGSAFTLELPGKKCSGTVAETIALECMSVKMTKEETA
ncbi:MAG: hypothetical protein C5B56_01065, partial [Proteobacteria bacterium]